MTVLSLFDGMSVVQQALKDAGVPVDKYYASEIDEYAIAVTQSNHPSTIQLGSVVGLNISENIDLLIGGSPCQDLSIAKRDRKGLEGSRSSLFWEYVRIRDEVRPKYFILENVASMPKEAKDVISKALGVEPVMINASLVSAQNRKRLFWVGKLQDDGSYKQVEISQPDDRGILLKDILEIDVEEKYFVSAQHTRAMINTRKSKKLNIPELDGKTGTLTASYYKIPNDGIYIPIRVGQIGKGGQGDRIYSPDGKSVGLSALGGGRGAKTGLYAVRSNYNNTLNFDKSNTLGSNSQCQTAKTGQGLVDFEKQIIRKLTPTECLRLQSMPDDYFDKAEYKGKPISNTQKYKMCGNAFNKEVIIHILNHLDF